MTVCVDASLVVTLLLPDERTAEVEFLFSEWTHEGTRLISPPLLYAEAPSAVLRAQFEGRIDPEDAGRAFGDFCDLDIAVVSANDLYIRAWELAKEHEQRRIYDSMYLALAQAEGCELWTGDLRLANSVDRPWVKWVGGQYEPGLSLC